MAHPAELPTEELLAHCETQRTRRSGPGGQHRNKVETAIVIKHIPTGLTAEANEKRSQAENKAVAIQRLRMVLAVEHRTERKKVNDTLQVSALLKSRIRNRKLAINPNHHDFATLLAEVLDLLAGEGFEIPRVASCIGLTNSQLLKFLKQHPPAFERFNSERGKFGLPRIKF